MCGIAGLWSSFHGEESLGVFLDGMVSQLRHRGPDGTAVWRDSSGQVGLAHTRLAIRDLTPTGAQPMLSADGRYSIVYNGEIYSQRELAAALAGRGVHLRGSSDTEAMLEHIAVFGLEATLPKLIGMFTFALWDSVERRLYLVRDRLGIKPLYWAQIDGLFAFASELKSFSALPGWSPSLNRDAVASFMRLQYIPAPHTIYQGVYKLEPASILTLDETGAVRVSKYWDLPEIAIQGIASRGRERIDLDEVDALLTDAVSRRLVSDVPVGALLSGGIDSSLVTALMAETSSTTIRSYSIGFTVEEFNEAHYAKAIAAHIGTDHTEMYVEPNHALEIVPTLARIYDEPFADSSQLPSVLLSQLTRQHVTVALTGDGGDELFAGYDRYALARAIDGRLSSIPRPLQRIAAATILGLPQSSLDRFGRRLPKRFRRDSAGAKLQEFARTMLTGDPNSVYRSMVTHWTSPNDLVIHGHETLGTLWDARLASRVPDLLDRMQLLDMLTYLPDDILVKMDRASMSVGLEARVPLLDHRLVELSWRLPQHMKVRDGETKWVLRRSLEKRVPRELTDRPKMGFGVPIDTWLRGPLRPWAEELLSEDRLRQQGLLHPGPIRARWAAHQSGENWAYPLWDVLMLQAWIDEWKPSFS